MPGHIFSAAMSSRSGDGLVDEDAVEKDWTETSIRAVFLPPHALQGAARIPELNRYMQ
jgi:hypothetical protein